MLAGILFPGPTSFLQPYPLYFMMLLLFLSFLSTDIFSVVQIMRHNPYAIVWLSFLKMILFPIGVYFVFAEFCPTYALGALLLTGISTGVVAPFVSTLMNANGPLVLAIVVISSITVPFTLPALVKLLVGQGMEIPLTGMIRTLSLVVFVPILSVEALRRLWPNLANGIMKRRYPISLVIFACINLAVFSKYAPFFHQNPKTIVVATFVAMAIGGMCVVAGLLLQWKWPVENQLASAIALGNMNNVLVIVFASRFFGHIEATLAAMYMIPFFGLIFPLRVYQRIREANRP